MKSTMICHHFSATGSYALNTMLSDDEINRIKISDLTILDVFGCTECAAPGVLQTWICDGKLLPVQRLLAQLKILKSFSLPICSPKTQKDTIDFQINVAILEQDVEQVKSLIEQGADVTDRNEYCGSSPFALACQLQSDKIVACILSSFSSTEEKRQLVNYRTPMQISLLACAETPAIAKLLIANGANIDEKHLLYHAFRRYKYDVAETLILAGCAMQYPNDVLQHDDCLLLQLVLQRDDDSNFLAVLLACGYKVPSIGHVVSSAILIGWHSFSMILTSCSSDIDDALAQYHSVAKDYCYNGNRLLYRADMDRSVMGECLDKANRLFIAPQRVRLHRNRMFEISCAFHFLPVLITVELIDACCLFASAIAYHTKWTIAKTIKYFIINR